MPLAVVDYSAWKRYYNKQCAVSRLWKKQSFTILSCSLNNGTCHVAYCNECWHCQLIKKTTSIAELDRLKLLWWQGRHKRWPTDIDPGAWSVSPLSWNIYQLCPSRIRCRLLTRFKRGIFHLEWKNNKSENLLDLIRPSSSILWGKRLQLFWQCCYLFEKRVFNFLRKILRNSLKINVTLICDCVFVTLPFVFS